MPTRPAIRAADGGVTLEVHVIPRAGRAGVAGVRDAALLVRLHAAPVEGAANKELVDLIADTFGVPRRAVTIVSGERSRKKRLHIAGISVEGADLKLETRHARLKT